MAQDDLHLVTGSVINAALNNYGQPISGISVDIDNQSRSVTAPDIGADEFTATGTCTTASGGTISQENRPPTIQKLSQLQPFTFL